MVRTARGEERGKILAGLVRELRQGVAGTSLEDLLYSRTSESPLARDLLPKGVAPALKAKAEALENAAYGRFTIRAGQLLDDALAGKPAQTPDLQLLKILQDTFKAPVALVFD